MIQRIFSTVCLLFLLFVSDIRAQAPVIPPGDEKPFVRLEAQGPTCFVTALAFSPDGQNLYEAGFDKVIRVWTWNAKAGGFELSATAYRIPIGPGLDGGAINAIALSPDGTWLAAAGMGVVRDVAGFREPGSVHREEDVMTPEMWEDRGTIYVFNTTNREVRLLRKHRGAVLSLAFAPTQENKSPLLVSAAQEWDAEKQVYTGMVRLWDVAGSAELDRERLPSPEGKRPGLAVWHTGKEPTQIRAALAWQDGAVRIWSPEGAQGQRLQSEVDGKFFNNTAVYLPDPTRPPFARIVTSSFRDDAHGQLRTWNIPPGEQARADAARQVSFAPVRERGILHVPRALAALPSRPQGPLDHVALVLRTYTGEVAQDRLRIIDLNSANFASGKGSEAPLWDGADTQPVLAASADGRFLAAAGNKNHEIKVFTVADLLNNRPKSQTLRSVGTTFLEASFVKKDKEFGLLLREAPKKKVGAAPRDPSPSGDLIFDLSKRALTANTAGWKSDTVLLEGDGWQVIHTPPVSKSPASESVPLVIAVRRPGRQELRVGLEAHLKTVTDFALVPPRPPLFDVPILAVAGEDQYRQPWIYLYNVANGERLRQFTGHCARIGSLAFSSDGRLLVSAAEDQTVSVWSLTDLGSIVGQRGLLPGVAIRQQDKDLVVVSVERDSAAARVLKKDDIIEAQIEDAKPRRLATPHDFYDVISRVKPGKTIILRVRRGANPPQDVSLMVSQAVDERKPLFSLFLTRAGKPAERDWLGWNPTGYYDSSSRRAESNLGWHFNTGNPNAPTAFAKADEYRKEFYRTDLLKHLMARGNVSQAIDDIDGARPKPQPRMALWIDEIGLEPRKQGQQEPILARQRKLTLKLTVNDFPLESVDRLEWEVDGLGPQKGRLGAGKFDLADGRERSLDLSQLPWKRGEFKVRAILHTREDEPRKFWEELTLRYQPAAPSITLKPAEQRRNVEKEDLTFAAAIRAGDAGEAVTVEFLHRCKGEPVVKDTIQVDPKQPASGQIIRQLKLRPGDNEIQMVAVNRDALAGHEDAETERVLQVVTYKQKIPPPLITLLRAVPLPSGAEESPPQEIVPGKPMIVDLPRIRIDGTIKATENLARLFLSQGEMKSLKPATEVEVAETVVLKPGPQTLRYRARTADSEEAEAGLTIEYRPRLPELIVTAPISKLVLYEGKDAPTIELRGQLTAPADPHPYSAVVLVNNGELTERPTIDAGKQTLTARIPLQPGDNRIEVRLQNAWKTVANYGDIHIRYLRPPRAVVLTGARETKKPFADLEAQVYSAQPLVEASVQVQVNGVEHKIGKVTIQPADQKPNILIVRLGDVPLDTGKKDAPPAPVKNEIQVRLSNADGRCLDPGAWTVVYTAPPPLRPDVAILNPQKDSPPVTEPKFTVQFQVRSSGPLRRLELVREHPVRPIHRQAFDVAMLKPDSSGLYKLRTELSLENGRNSVRVEAVNDGGEERDAVVINYIFMPVRLDVVRLEPGIGQPKKLADGSLSFPPAPAGRLWVHGQVTWDKDSAAQLAIINQARVYVNGFPQQPTPLKPVSDRANVKEFKAEIVLDSMKNNVVKIELPGLKQDAGNRAQFSIDCQKPEQRQQRLHLLIVGVGEKDAKKLKERVYQSLQARATTEGEFTTPAFQRGGLLYGPVTGYVKSDYVLHQLNRIKKAVAEPRGAGPLAHDVVLIYYQGNEAVTTQGHFFLMSDSQNDPDLRRSAVTCDILAERFAETLGPKVLLLDVVRIAGDGKDQLADWPDDSHVGVLRYVWLGKTGTPEEDARLIKTLEETLPQSSKMAEVDSHVREKFASLVLRYPMVAYDRYLPSMLAGVVVGPKP